MGDNTFYLFDEKHCQKVPENVKSPGKFYLSRRTPVDLFFIFYSLISSRDLPMVSLPRIATTIATIANTAVSKVKM